MTNPMGEIDPKTTFISYATKYDGYVGSKRWNEILPSYRVKIAKCEFRTDNFDYESLVMASGLFKSQAAGLRALIVSVEMWFEKFDGTIAASESSIPPERILKFFTGTRFFDEFSALVEGDAQENSNYDGVELEAVAFGGIKTSPLDDALDMDLSEAKRFILSFLETNTPLEKPKASDFDSNQEEKESTKTSSRFLESDATSIGFARRLLRYGFAPVEVYWICEEIDFFFETYETLTSNQIQKLALKMAQDSDRAKYSIRVDHKKPKEIALLLIRNAAMNLLGSGAHHIYRGVLSIAGTGYLSIFRRAVDAAVRLGYETTEAAAADQQDLDRLIKALG